MTRYSIEPRKRKYVKGFLSFARKYKKKQLTVTGLDSLKTFSKIVVRKTCESLENRSADAATNSDDKQNLLKK